MFYSYEDQRAAEDEALGLGAPFYYVAGVPCHSYAEALMVSGADHPDDIDAEMAYRDAENEAFCLRAPVVCIQCRAEAASETGEDPWGDMPF